MIAGIALIPLMIVNRPMRKLCVGVGQRYANKGLLHALDAEPTVLPRSGWLRCPVASHGRAGSSLALGVVLVGRYAVKRLRRDRDGRTLRPSAMNRVAGYPVRRAAQVAEGVNHARVARITRYG